MKCKKIRLGDGQMIKFIIGLICGVAIMCCLVIAGDSDDR